ncbi:hypothetical protein V2W45_1230463, partial [Cenococcum geophilum]
IVLLNEANIYLKVRFNNNLKRNSISIKVFLRTLDCFKGILFLTTNRVGLFNEAFLIQIHILPGYNPLGK